MNEGATSAETVTAEVAATAAALAVEPLTRRNYKRLPIVERQIRDALPLDAAGLIARAQQRDESAADHLSPEALVYFIRRADRGGDRKTMNALFRQLLERCSLFFRGKFRGFTPEVRKDLQQEVLKKLTEDVLAADDRGDFAQVRFWSYIERKTIDACRAAFRHAGDTESLDTGYSGDGENEGRTKLEQQVDRKLTPEQLTLLSKGLERLPPKLRQVFIMRHALGFAIGSDDPTADAANDLTLARRFGVSGKTIRNRLKKADELLAGFQEE
jgi:DNA-directed RNA polymerase specialized sigma24 family protein